MIFTRDAFAKINLGLAVLGKQAQPGNHRMQDNSQQHRDVNKNAVGETSAKEQDNAKKKDSAEGGFHTIDTVMVRLNLKDELTLEILKRPALEVAVVGEEASELQASLASTKDNLVYRATQAYLNLMGDAYQNTGAVVTLQKNIPIAAGLGGGSANVAAVLQALALALPEGIDLFPLANALGSDMAFFILNVAAARAQGRGERLTPLYLPRLYVVLVKPPVSVRAKEAYDAVDLQNVHTARAMHMNESGDKDEDGNKGEADMKGGYSDTASTHNVANTVRAPSKQTSSGQSRIISVIIDQLQKNQLPNVLPNDLEPGICRMYPEVANVLQILREVTDLKGISMSGSGSTCFGLAHSAQHARDIAGTLKRLYPQWWIRATHTI